MELFTGGGGGGGNSAASAAATADAGAESPSRSESPGIAPLGMTLGTTRQRSLKDRLKSAGSSITTGFSWQDRERSATRHAVIFHMKKGIKMVVHNTKIWKSLQFYRSVYNVNTHLVPATGATVYLISSSARIISTFDAHHDHRHDRSSRRKQEEPKIRIPRIDYLTACDELFYIQYNICNVQAATLAQGTYRSNSAIIAGTELRAAHARLLVLCTPRVGYRRISHESTRREFSIGSSATTMVNFFFNREEHRHSIPRIGPRHDNRKHLDDNATRSRSRNRLDPKCIVIVVDRLNFCVLCSGTQTRRIELWPRTSSRTHRLF
ncbi:unnamed protein product [Trichogramma brassicae]|uniref:Uncharacterized protein n=1 Tax=Trichogramma brassicae TaxID=86971 RepID=A0A6H5J5H8_9HYME|nr:unnamed protein product [Trichogramma brassicae]